MTDTAAVIGKAKLRGLIASAREVFFSLHASSLHITLDVSATVLKRVAGL